MKLPFPPGSTNRTCFAPFDFKRFGIVACLGSSTISLIAQEPVHPTVTAAVDSLMAFRQQLDARKLSPEQRIAAIDQWRKANGSPLAILRPQESASNSITLKAALIARQKQAALAVSGTDDERELAELQLDVAAAVQEMRSYDITAAKRIGMFDEFRAANREAFQRIRTLRKAISERKMENAPPPVDVQPAPHSQAEAALLERRSSIMEEIATMRTAGNRLSPEERIAAMDRDLTLFKERLASLREIGRQLQTLPAR